MLTHQLSIFLAGVAGLAALLVCHLVRLEFREHRRNNRMDAQRKRLGLNRTRLGRATQARPEPMPGQIFSTGFLSQSPNGLNKRVAIEPAPLLQLSNVWALETTAVKEMDTRASSARCSRPRSRRRVCQSATRPSRYRNPSRFPRR
jgi:hypothetical protein